MYLANQIVEAIDEDRHTPIVIVSVFPYVLRHLLHGHGFVDGAHLIVHSRRNVNEDVSGLTSLGRNQG